MVAARRALNMRWANRAPPKVTVHVMRFWAMGLPAIGIGMTVPSCATGHVEEVEVLSAFSWEATDRLDIESQNSPRVLVETAPGAVLLRGQAFDPCYGWDLVAKASRRADTLLLEVDWPGTEICGDIDRGFEYEAVLSPVEAAEYRLRVRQRVLVREPWSYPHATVLDTVIRVPS